MRPSRRSVTTSKSTGLEGLVVASCSPKLHTVTFRGVAKRSGLNPYRYTQVNLREQCSWAHTDDHEGATEKAIRLVRAGVARTRLLEPLEPTIVETVPKTLVVGAGIAGLRAAIGLADIGLAVVVIEREAEVGGWVKDFGPMFPHEKDGRELIAELLEQVRWRENRVVHRTPSWCARRGSFGNYEVDIAVAGDPEAIRRMEVGSIIVVTGFDSYQPAEGEYGYGIDGVVTLPEFKQMVDAADGAASSTHGTDGPKDVAYIYCVGSRQGDAGPNQYCSRFCCTAAVHASLGLHGKDPPAPPSTTSIGTCAPTDASSSCTRSPARRVSLYIKFPAEQAARGEQGHERQARGQGVRRVDEPEDLQLPVDLVVLVTGMVPRKNEELVQGPQASIGRDGFFNEIHPELRPVETVVDGVLRSVGACQFPKTSSESVTSGLAAVTWSAAMLKQGRTELDPQVATIDPELCTGAAICVETCPTTQSAS